MAPHLPHRPTPCAPACLACMHRRQCGRRRSPARSGPAASPYGGACLTACMGDLATSASARAPQPLLKGGGGFQLTAAGLGGPALHGGRCCSQAREWSGVALWPCACKKLLAGWLERPAARAQGRSSSAPPCTQAGRQAERGRRRGSARTHAAGVQQAHHSLPVPVDARRAAACASACGGGHASPSAHSTPAQPQRLGLLLTSPHQLEGEA